MQLPSRRFFLNIIIGSLVLTALLGVIAIITSGLGDTGSKVLATTVAVDVSAVLALCCAGKTKSSLQKYVQFIGILSSLTGLVLVFYLIWAGDVFYSTGSEGVLRAFGAMLILAVSSAHACLILPSMVYNDTLRAIVRATLVCIAIVAELLINLVAIPDFSAGDSYGKVIAVVLIFDVLGTIVIPLLHRFGPPSATVLELNGVASTGGSLQEESKHDQ